MLSAAPESELPARRETINLFSIPKEKPKSDYAFEGLQLGQETETLKIFKRLEEAIFAKMSQIQGVGDRKKIVELNHMVVNFFVFANSIASFLPRVSANALDEMLEDINAGVRNKFAETPGLRLADININESYNGMLHELMAVEKALLEEKKVEIATEIKDRYHGYIEGLNRDYHLLRIKDNSEYDLDTILDEIIGLEALLGNIMSTLRNGATPQQAKLETTATIVQVIGEKKDSMPKPPVSK